ncbi:MAG TPA: hypothetical protein VN026_15615 [Bacteroidia bacterium]|jgi:hypothetical protein|nr:hypothetical protein [Bacteroidia bacterium]
MRSLILSLRAGKTSSEIVKINNSENTFTLLPFRSNITGLQLIFQYQNGEKKIITIYETEIERNIENIGIFNCLWFEYATTDMNYPINVLLKK